MQCSVEQCENPVRYKAACLCQKHYFRRMRYGTTDLVRKPACGRLTSPNGYSLVYVGPHHLKTNNGYLFEHRKVVFDKYGVNLPDCELCSKKLNWETCHVDHIDNNRKNNDPSNLRPLCSTCNTRREYPDAHTMKGNHAIDLDGVTLTANEWSRAGDGYLSHNAIVRRIKSGMTAEQALLTAKTTHKGDVPYTRESLIEQARRIAKERT